MFIDRNILPPWEGRKGRERAKGEQQMQSPRLPWRSFSVLLFLILFYLRRWQDAVIPNSSWRGDLGKHSTWAIATNGQMFYQLYWLIVIRTCACEVSCAQKAKRKGMIKKRKRGRENRKKKGGIIFKSEKRGIHQIGGRSRWRSPHRPDRAPATTSGLGILRLLSVAINRI